MSAFSLSDWIWPDVDQGRKPQHPVSVAPGFDTLDFAFLLDSSIFADLSQQGRFSQNPASYASVPNGRGNLAWQGSRTSHAVSNAIYKNNPAAYTILTRLKLGASDTAQDSILGMGSGGTAQQITLHTNIASAGDVYAAHSNNDIKTGGGALSTTAWHDVVVVYLGGGITTTSVLIYIDGVQQSTTRAGIGGSTLALDTTRPIYLGSDQNSTSRYNRGAVDYIYFFHSALPLDVIKALQANPLSLFTPPILNVYAAGAGSVSVSPPLSGVSATSAVGSLVASPAAVPSGAAATGAAGTLTPTTAETVSLTGVAATGSPGALVVETDAAPAFVGVAASGVIGGMVLEVDNAPVGVQATGVTQALSIEINTALVGIAGTGQVGNVTETTGTDGVFAGTQAMGTVQGLTVEIDKAFTGVAATGAAQALGIEVGKTLAGVSTVGAAGAMSIFADATPAFAGVVGTGQAGILSVTIGSNTSVAITGVVGTAFAGLLLPQEAANDSGVEGTGQVGDLGALRLVSFNGVVCFGQVGGLRAGEFAFIRNRVEFSPRFSATVSTAPRFSATVSTAPRFSATVSKGVKF